MKLTDRILLFLLAPMMVVALYLAFLYAPEERVMGVVQRIFYFHVASAWTGLLSFLLVFIGGVLFSNVLLYQNYLISMIEKRVQK